jgi:hypothetical protein
MHVHKCVSVSECRTDGGLEEGGGEGAEVQAGSNRGEELVLGAIDALREENMRLELKLSEHKVDVPFGNEQRGVGESERRNLNTHHSLGDTLTL